LTPAPGGMFEKVKSGSSAWAALINAFDSGG